MGLIQRGGISKFLIRILLLKDNLKIKRCWAFFEKIDGTISQMDRLQKIKECDYKDNTLMILKKVFTCEMISEKNLKDNGKKTSITNTEILKVIIGKLFFY